jgi:hypothetical protein
MNSKTGRIMVRVGLPCSESLYRKVTRSPLRRTILLLAMALRWVYAPAAEMPNDEVYRVFGVL